MNAKNMILSALLGLALTSACLLASADEDQSAGSDPSQTAEPHRHHPRLTEAQRDCLEGILGKPGQGERPTHEEVHAAFQKCNIRPPAHRAAASTDPSANASANASE